MTTPFGSFTANEMGIIRIQSIVRGHQARRRAFKKTNCYKYSPYGRIKISRYNSGQ